MLRDRLMRLVQSPLLYDLLQRFAGDREVQRRLDVHTTAPPGSWVVDIGGGTGPRRTPHGGSRYVCFDLDVQKLQRFRSKHPDGLAVAGDAVHCPLKTGGVDAVVCSKVTHHLNDDALHAVFEELGRLVKEGGTLILADAVRSDRWVARLLWRLDRGSHPRSADAIRRALPAVFVISRWDCFRTSVFHDFVLCVARRVPAVPSEGAAGDQPRRVFSRSA